MKITKIEERIVRVPADEPLADGPTPQGAMRDLVTLRVGTDEGIEGIGYTFFGAALIASLRQAVEDLGNLAVGEDPLRTEAVHAKLRSAAGINSRRHKALALSPIDIALWASRARRRTSRSADGRRLPRPGPTTPAALMRTFPVETQQGRAQAHRRASAR